MIPTLGFTPDLDETQPGVLVDVSGFIPSQKGMRAAPTPSSVGIAALAAACRGSALARNLSATNTLYAGTATKLYKAGSATWTDVSGATTFALGVDERWIFAQYGNDTLAGAISSKILKATTGDFAEITAAPKAQIVLSAFGFVIALHTNEATYGDQTDRWWCSAYLDNTDWTPAVATQCTTGRIVEGGGPITAGAVFGDEWVAFKRRGIFHARYAGAPIVWSVSAVPGAYGCVGQEAVINIGGALLVAAEDDIYIYDGVRPQSLLSGFAKRWFASNLSQSWGYRTKILWDRINARAWVFFPSSSSAGECDTALVVGIEKLRWGKVAIAIEAPVAYATPSITYDGGDARLSTYDGGGVWATVPYDSPFWNTGIEAPAVFTNTHTLSTLSGVAGSCSFTTGDFGDDDSYSHLSRFGVRFLQAPTSATATGYEKNDSGAMVALSSSALRDDNVFDLRQTARWHRVTVTTTGECELTGTRPELKAAGRR